MPSNKSPVIVRIPGCCCPSSSTTQPKPPIKNGATPVNFLKIDITEGNFVVGEETTGGIKKFTAGNITKLNGETATIENPDDGTQSIIKTESIKYIGGNHHHYYPPNTNLTINIPGYGNTVNIYRTQSLQSSNFALEAIVRTSD